MSDGRVLQYKMLVVATGIVAAWDAIPGLADPLEKNGITSNYRYDMAPYTKKLVQGLKGNPAIFTRPPIPFECLGAPKKAMYLSCATW